MRQKPSMVLHFGNVPHPWDLPVVKHKMNITWNSTRDWLRLCSYDLHWELICEFWCTHIYIWCNLYWVALETPTFHMEIIGIDSGHRLAPVYSAGRRVPQCVASNRGNYTRRGYQSILRGCATHNHRIGALLCCCLLFCTWQRRIITLPTKTSWAMFRHWHLELSQGASNFISLSLSLSLSPNFILQP
jgi:hypothetical protein